MWAELRPILTLTKRELDTSSVFHSGPFRHLLSPLLLHCAIVAVISLPPSPSPPPPPPRPGDLANENPEFTARIASLPLPKAVILGNHDSWNSMSGSAQRRRELQVGGRESSATPGRAQFEGCRRRHVVCYCTGALPFVSLPCHAPCRCLPASR